MNLTANSFVMNASDWKTLADLRQRFLHHASGSDYWQSDAQIALYDRFLAMRIRWKWDDVLTTQIDCAARLPQFDFVMDWGCGSGVASRAVAQHLPITKLAEWRLHDRSQRAMDFACRVLTEEFPDALARQCAQAPKTLPPNALLLISHVINELDSAKLESLIALARTAKAVIWVEGGTMIHAKSLGVVRSQLLSSHSIVAPCTHQLACPISGSDWCHHFAKIPSWIFQDPLWARFSREASIDLHRLPYSYLLACRDLDATSGRRVIGKPRFFKGYSKALTCDASGALERQYSARKDSADYRSLCAGKTLLIDIK
jgi:ribosomal protein RSM22 (predicted rRNA methylase)